MKMFALALALMLPCLAAGPEWQKDMGNPTAPLRMDLWDDFTCPHCKMLHDQILPRIIADYVTPGKAYLVFHEFTLTGPGTRAFAGRPRCTPLRRREWASTSRLPTRCSRRSPRGR